MSTSVPAVAGKSKTLRTKSECIERALQLNSLGYAVTPATQRDVVVDQMLPVRNDNGEFIRNADGTKKLEWQPGKFEAKKAIGNWGNVGRNEDDDEVEAHFKKQLDRILRAAKTYRIQQAADHLGCAIVCGPSGIGVIDIDAGKLPDPDNPGKMMEPNAAHDLLVSRMLRLAGYSETEIAELIAHLRTLVHVRTPSGGWHYYFKRGKNQKPRSHTGIITNVDIRGGFPRTPSEEDPRAYESNGITYAPGNVTEKGDYRVYATNEDGELVELPTLPPVNELPELPDQLADLFAKSTTEARALAVKLGIPVPAKSSTSEVRATSKRDGATHTKNGKRVTNTLGGVNVWREDAEAALVTSAQDSDPLSIASDGAALSYVATAIGAELEKLAETGEGGRNAAVFKCGCTTYGWVKAGVLTQDKAEELIENAADQQGYVSEDYAGFEKTLNSAWARAEARDLDEVRAKLQARKKDVERVARKGAAAPAKRDAAPATAGGTGGGDGGDDEATGGEGDGEPSGDDDSWMPEGFFRDDDGNICTNIERKTKKSSLSVPIIVCSNIDIIGRGRDKDSGNYGKFVRICQPCGKVVEIFVPDAISAADEREFIKLLASNGVRVQPSLDARAALRILFTNANPATNFRTTDETGWFGEKRFVTTTGEVIGKQDSKDTLVYNGQPAQGSAKAGTLASFNNEVVGRISGQDLPILALLFGLTAPFRKPLDTPGVIFNVHGISGDGKSTTAHIAQSPWGYSPKLLNWNATANGLEGQASAHNDGLMPLDELHQAKKGVVGQVVYGLANGRGKAAMTQRRALRKASEYTVSVWSTGEASIAGRIASDGYGGDTAATAGQMARGVDIPSDMGAGHGVFSFIPKGVTAKAYADGINAALKGHHGTMGPALVDRYLRDPVKALEVIDGRRKDFIQKFTSFANANDTQFQRVLEHFALCYGVGIYAVASKVLKLTTADVSKAVIVVLKHYVKSRGGVGNTEETESVARVDDYIAQNHGLFTRFDYKGRTRGTPQYGQPLGYAEESYAPAPGAVPQPPAKAAKGNVHALPTAGSGRIVIGGKEYLSSDCILTTTYYLPIPKFCEACGGIDQKIVAGYLKGHGRLEHDKDRLTIKRMFEGARARYYAVKVVDEQSIAGAGAGTAGTAGGASAVPSHREPADVA